MTVELDRAVDTDLMEAFNHYEGERSGLGREFLDEFRRAIELIVEHPRAWQLLALP